MNELYEQIKIIGESLQLGATKRIHCLFCNAVHENSLAITRDSFGIKFICPRAKCGKKGIIPLLASTKERPEFLPSKFREYLSPLTARQKKWLASKYELSSEDVVNFGLRYAPESNRLHVHLTNSTGEIIGDWAKLLPSHLEGGSVFKLKKEIDNKVGIFQHKEGALMHCPIPISSHVTNVILVEDCISAIKLCSLGYYSIALLGTELTSSMLATLKHVTDSITLALDPDAIAKALRHKKNYDLLFKEIKIWNTTEDPKDMKVELIRANLEELGIIKEVVV